MSMCKWCARTRSSDRSRLSKLAHSLSLSLASFHFAYDGDKIRLEVGGNHAGCSGKENSKGNPPVPGERDSHLFRTPEGKLKSDIQSNTQLTIRRFAYLTRGCLCVGKGERCLTPDQHAEPAGAEP